MSAIPGSPFCIIQEGKQKSLDLAHAIIAGCGQGSIGIATKYVDIPDRSTPVFVGLHPTTIEALWQARLQRRPFVTVDNGYFHPYKNGGYYRATSNALQWIDRAAADPKIATERWAAHNLKIDPWRDDDGHVLLALQSPTWFEMMGYDQETWIKAIVDIIRLHTDREIRVRRKPLKGVKVPPLGADLAGAKAVVAMSSNTLIDAALRGIPVYPLYPCAATPLGTTAISRLEGAPYQPDTRLKTFEALAAAQWTLEEIASGRMWADLQKQYAPEFKAIT